MTARRANLPGLGRGIRSGIPALDRWIEQVTERLEVREGTRGDPLERAVTVRELTDLTTTTVTITSAGPAGPAGATGATGAGVAPGGATGQQLAKASGMNYDTRWVSEPFDVHAFYPGLPTVGAVVLRVPLARAVTFPANLAGSYGKAAAAATAAVSFDVQKNGVSVGTITFAAGAATATFSSGGAAVTFAAGDVLSIIAPGSADATLADVGIVLAGTR